MDCNTAASLSFTISQSWLKLMSMGWWCHPTNLSPATPLSPCPRFFPESRSFPRSWLFASGGQSTGASAPASVHPLNIQDWFPSGMTGLISLLSTGLSRVISSVTVWKHQFLDAQLSLPSNSHICTWLLEKNYYHSLALTVQTLLPKWYLCFLIHYLGLS